MIVSETNRRRQAETINRGLAAGCAEPGSSLEPWIGDAASSIQAGREDRRPRVRDQKPERADPKREQLQDIFLTLLHGRMTAKTRVPN